MYRPELAPELSREGQRLEPEDWKEGGRSLEEGSTAVAFIETRLVCCDKEDWMEEGVVEG
jgi:hypothetical protein